MLVKNNLKMKKYIFIIVVRITLTITGKYLEKSKNCKIND